MADKLHQIFLKNFSHFIETVEKLNETDPSKTIIYRGQTQDFPLLPSISRNNPTIDTTDVEVTAVEELKRRSRLKMNKDLIDDWDWLVFSQHFGLRTRLLDWSSNPLVGLWFSCFDEEDWDKDGFLYALVVDDNVRLDRDKDKSPFERNRTRVYRPHLNNERIVAQSGWFTAHGFSTSAKRFVRLDKNTLLKKYLTKFVIPKDLKLMFMEKLNLLGINYEKLFPDIEGICNQINFEFKL
ncbi:MAG: FRG domain-containing protein [Deltaproteobacteria bacterium]|nr:FRG domain-containing protein [Deltaproteobacteria bacterium]